MRKTVLLFIGVFASIHWSGNATEISSLAGQWRFALDAQDVGIGEKWFAKDLQDKILLPGVLQAQDYGDEISTNTPWVTSLGDAWWKIQSTDLREPFSRPGKVRVPFLSQPPRHYLGAAWYQREITIPEASPSQHCTLFLERAHWRSTVWVDEKVYPSNDSLGTPHVTDLGVLAPGKHRLTILVDNRTQLPALGHLVDSHSISDALGATWNGIVGKIELRRTPPVWIEDVQVFPHTTRKSVTIKGRIASSTGKSGQHSVAMSVTPFLLNGKTPLLASTNFLVSWSTDAGTFETDLFLGSNAGAWDEFVPVIFRLAIALEASTNHFLFGLREVTTRDKDILINGRPVNLRMTHFGGDFPLTGWPAMDVASWKNIIRTCKDYGLNGIRFHSWCPPEAAFEAADELGLYLQPECGLWADFGNLKTREFLEAETARIIKAYGNHPSFLLLSPSNEPRNYSRYLPQWAKENYARDNRRLYSAATGWSDPSQVDGKAQFATLVRYGKGQLRNATGWFGNDYSDALKDIRIPVIAHEVGQWCAYPDFDVVKKFTGYLQPGNYEIFEYIAGQNGLREMNKEFSWASGRFQLACYKEEIEANLRTPGLAGFQLLDLHDYLGQGTALIGVLDAFWQTKGYTTSQEFGKFCGPIVPLAWLRKRVFSTDEKLEGAIGLAHFGSHDLTNALVGWEVCDENGRVVRSCAPNAPRNIPVGFKTKCLDFEMDLNGLAAPARYKLAAKVDSGGQRFENDWSIWLYPAQVENSKTDDVLVTSAWPDAEQKLAVGGKVLFLPTNRDLDPRKCPRINRVPVFWNIQMTVRPPQNPRPRFDAMLGLLCDTNHPGLAKFPTDKNCDWQWTPLIDGIRPVNLTATRDLRPVVWVIDDWNRNWKLGVIFECKVGAGRLLVSAINLNERKDPQSAQLRRSLLDYMGTRQFEPATTLTPEQVRGFWSRGVSSPAGPARVFDPDLNDGSIGDPSVRRRFHFGSNPLPAGFTQVNPQDTYDPQRGFGFLEPRLVGATNHTVSLFVVDVEEGNYDVTVRLGDSGKATATTIKSESRRLMLENVETAPGQFQTRSFTVNVRKPAISAGSVTLLNDREKGPPPVPDWDEHMTFEFNGGDYGVASMEINPAADAITIFLAGDSTVTDQVNEPWAGWGQMLPRFFRPGVAVSNQAESGLALFSFERQKRLEKVLSMMRRGDYLFIQFGHNDQKDKRPDAGPFTTYKTNLKRFVEAARGGGGIPVLVTPMERRRWKDNQPQPTLTDYAEAVRQVGVEEDVPVIDLNLMSLALYRALGPEKSKKAFVHYAANTFPGQDKPLEDDTHHSAYGGYELARCVVEGIKAKLPQLAMHLAADARPFDPARPDSPDDINIPASPPARDINPR